MTRLPRKSCYEGTPSNGDGPQTFEPLSGTHGIRPPTKTRRLDHLFKRDGGKCYWCGYVWPTRFSSKRDELGHVNYCTQDHLIPRSKGGTHSFDNLVLACLSCNKHKGSMMPDEYRELIKKD